MYRYISNRIAAAAGPSRASMNCCCPAVETLTEGLMESAPHVIGRISAHTSLNGL